MPGQTYFRRNSRNNTPDPVMDLVGFKGNNRTGEETSVRNTRQTIARTMVKDGLDIDAIADLLGKEAEITIPSMASKTEAAIAGLNQARNSKTAKVINDAVAALRSQSVQELHLLPFDGDLDGEFAYQKSDQDTEYYIVARRAYLNPKTGRPSAPSSGNIARVFITVGDDPQAQGNRREPSGQQIRHGNWRKQVTAEGLAVSASVVHTFRIVGVNHVLATSGDRTESQMVFYVEGYSFWSDGASKMMVPRPSMNGEESSLDSEESSDSPAISVSADFGDDEDGNPLD
jgi:hypothetical protein